MVLKYNDPYGNRKYAQLKGDKADAYFNIEFSEAVIHKTNEGYVLFGQVDKYDGIVRSFKPENPITPGLCIVPLYKQEYEVRKKNKDESWSSEKMQPSVFEKLLCERIEAYDGDWMPHNASIKGRIVHVPDAMLEHRDKAGQEGFVADNAVIEQIDSTGKIPDYTPSTSGGQRRSYGGDTLLSPVEKLAFIKKQMEEDVKDLIYKQGQCLADLTDQIIKEHSDNENFIQIYFDLLIACVR